MKKLAQKLNNFDWKLKQLPKLFWTPSENSRMYEDHLGKEIRFRSNKKGQLTLIRTTYSDTQVFLQFAGYAGEESKDIVILVIVGDNYKTGSQLSEECFYGLV